MYDKEAGLVDGLLIRVGLILSIPHMFAMEEKDLWEQLDSPHIYRISGLVT